MGTWFTHFNAVNLSVQFSGCLQHFLKHLARLSKHVTTRVNYESSMSQQSDTMSQLRTYPNAAVIPASTQTTTRRGGCRSPVTRSCDVWSHSWRASRSALCRITWSTLAKTNGSTVEGDPWPGTKVLSCKHHGAEKGVDDWKWLKLIEKYALCLSIVDSYGFVHLDMLNIETTDGHSLSVECAEHGRGLWGLYAPLPYKGTKNDEAAVNFRWTFPGHSLRPRHLPWVKRQMEGAPCHEKCRVQLPTTYDIQTVHT